MSSTLPRRPSAVGSSPLADLRPAQELRVDIRFDRDGCDDVRRYVGRSKVLSESESKSIQSRFCHAVKRHHGRRCRVARCRRLHRHPSANFMCLLFLAPAIDGNFHL